MTPHKHIIALSNEFLTPTQEFMLPTREFIKNEYYSMIATHIKLNCYDEPAHEILLDNLSIILYINHKYQLHSNGPLLLSLRCRIFLDIWIWS